MDVVIILRKVISELEDSVMYLDSYKHSDELSMIYNSIGSLYYAISVINKYKSGDSC